MPEFSLVCDLCEKPSCVEFSRYLGSKLVSYCKDHYDQWRMDSRNRGATVASRTELDPSLDSVIEAWLTEDSAFSGFVYFSRNIVKLAYQAGYEKARSTDSVQPVLDPTGSPSQVEYLQAALSDARDSVAHEHEAYLRVSTEAAAFQSSLQDAYRDYKALDAAHVARGVELTDLKIALADVRRDLAKERRERELLEARLEDPYGTIRLVQEEVPQVSAIDFKYRTALVDLLEAARVAWSLSEQIDPDRIKSACRDAGLIG